MSTSVFIVVFLANLLCRCCALAVAFGVSLWILARFGRPVAQLACGMLLAISLGHLIPEAIETGIAIYWVVSVLVASLLAFYLFDLLLEKAFGHIHATGKPRAIPVLLGGGFEVRADLCGARTRKAFPILVGSASHNFVDGILVAAAFTTSTAAGMAITAAIFAHEVPQLVGQLAILKRFSWSKDRSLVALALVAMVAVLGGIAGSLLFSFSRAFIPYAMLVSAAAFLFVAMVLVKEDFLGEKFETKTLLASLFFVSLGIVASLLILSVGHG